MRILEKKPRDPSPHVPWIKPCKRSTHVPRMKPREIPACPPEMKPTNEVQKWNHQRYLHVFQKEIVRDIWMYARMKPPEISECTNETDVYIYACVPERNRQRYLSVRIKLTDIYACVPEWNRQRYPSVRMKLTDISACDREWNRQR